MKGWMAMALLAVAAAPAGSSRQAAYDAAQAAYDKGDWAVAAAGFAPLLPADGTRPLQRGEAVIAIRLADALLRTGRPAEAGAVARRGIAGIPDTDPLTLADGWDVIGDADRLALNVAGATDAYGKALRYASGAGYDWRRVAAATGLGMTLATVDPVRAAAALDALLADRTLVAGLAKPVLAGVDQVRAEIALNAGDLPGATSWIDRALQASGGLGTRVSQAQVAIRGDAAIIAQRRGDPGKAHEYLTYTGAGHLESTDWITSFTGDLPVCESAGGLRPDDSAVVELTIDPADGHVLSAAPVYASRPGDVGMAFARAVQGWRWRPASLAKVNRFWLASLRLEMRCDTRPDPEALGRPIIADAARWLTSRGVLTPDQTDTDPVSSGARGPGTLLNLASEGDAKRLDALVDSRDAPASVRAVVIVADALSARKGSFREHAQATVHALAATVPAFATRYPDSIELAWLRLEWATALERSGDFGAALPLLGLVLATPDAALPRDDAIRKVAMLHLALVRARTGDAAGAQAGLRAAGLSAEQCSLVDTRPVPTNLSIVSSQFPQEALRWHFEGFARVAYDIGADGHVSGIRTVLAYPPFIFGPGTEAAARSFRYAAPTLDGKAVGCQGEAQTVFYQIPG